MLVFLYKNQGILVKVSMYTHTWNFVQVDSLLYLLSDIYLVNEKTKSQVNFISSFFRADMNFRCLQQRAKKREKRSIRIQIHYIL